MPRRRLSFNEGWRFLREQSAPTPDPLSYAEVRAWVLPSGDTFRATPAPVPQGPEPSAAFAAPGFDDSSWREVSLPHDWGVEGAFQQDLPGETGKLPWWGIGWYRKTFRVDGAAADSRCYIEFDGAMSHALVWLNGRFVGGWPYGYASFRLDLTPHLNRDGDNTITVRLSNPPESSRWYPGGGIYRDVWLVQTGPIHIGPWGTCVTTPEVSSAEATIAIRSRIKNHLTQAATVKIRTAIFPADNFSEGASPLAETPEQTVDIPPQATTTCASSAELENPSLWCVDSPNRYVALTTVEQDGAIVDRYETMFGIRTIRFDAAEGFLLNGQSVRMNGVCQHHDLGALGAAVHPAALERQVRILREMGVNAIRTSHNPPAPQLLDICDRLGVLVIDEAFDTWTRAKRPNDYHHLFPDWHEADLRALVRRDRNHPCVVLWSTGNEIAEQGLPEGQEISRGLAAIVRAEDPTRPVTVGCNFPEAGFNGFQNSMDVFGFNYKPHLYAEFRNTSPQIPCYGSETASTISSRGEYVFPVSEEREDGRENYHVSSYDLYTPRWATIPDTEFVGQDQVPGVFGEFVWTGFDYLGEPTPYNSDSSTLLNFSDPAERAQAEEELKTLGRLQVPSRSSYFGIVDLAGFKKDRFFLYQARWRPDLPMAHILPHWNWPDRVGENTPVHVYTSGDEAELFLNGRSLGRQQRARLTYRFRWDSVPYEPGELRVVVHKNGELWAEAVQRTAGPPAAIHLESESPSLRPDGRDLGFVRASIVDANGLPVPRSHHPVTFSLSGPGEILATDNGDPTSHDPFQSTSKAAFNGLVLAIVRPRAGEAGELVLQAESPGVASATLRIALSH
jgi:beta-galactosidase